MIARTPAPVHAARWQHALAEAIRDPAELLDLLELPRELLARTAAGARQFPLRVPRGYAARMTPGDPHDPLLRQVLPLDEDLAAAPGYSSDPLEEGAAMAAPGLLHKYHGRVLLVATGACGVHCRYCFRRHFPYAEANPRAGGWSAALAYIRDDPSIREVILSGGDPLSLADAALARLVERLAAIEHVQCLRIHTRQPIVLPERVDAELLEWLAATPLRTVMVLHCNHPREIDAAVADALQRLQTSGTTLLNQAVLLRGVNDDAGVLAELSERLFAAGVLPYYLHLLDRVRGAAHFEVDEPRARALLAALEARLPGYLVPRLARELPGRPAKTRLAAGP